MPTEVSISNQAIIRVGGNIIISLDDESIEAQICKAFYEPTRDIVLEEFQWSFAIKRYVLPQVVADPSVVNAGQYSGYFLQPADILNIIRVADNPDDRTPASQWAKEGPYITSNIKQAYVKAVAQVTDPKQFSAMFTQAFMLRLASEIAMPLAQSANLQKSLLSEYGQAVRAASARDGQQGTPLRIRSNEYVAVRSMDNGGSYLGPYV